MVGRIESDVVFDTPRGPHAHLDGEGHECIVVAWYELTDAGPDVGIDHQRSYLYDATGLSLSVGGRDKRQERRKDRGDRPLEWRGAQLPPAARNRIRIAAHRTAIRLRTLIDMRSGSHGQITD